MLLEMELNFVLTHEKAIAEEQLLCDDLTLDSGKKVTLSYIEGQSGELFNCQYYESLYCTVSSKESEQ